MRPGVSASAGNNYHALSSPASLIDLDLDASAASPLIRSPPYDESCVLPSEPGSVEKHPVTTPLTDHPSYPNMNLIVGGALAPLSVSLPRCPPVRSGPGLRLPSFRDLGIESPHPDRFAALALGHDTALLSPSLDGTMKESVGLAASPSCPSTSSPPPCPTQHIDPKHFSRPGRTVSTPFRHDVATLTPPAESGDTEWLPVANVAHAPMPSPATDQSQTGASTPGEQGGGGPLAPPPSDPEQPVSPSGGRVWIQGALEALLENLRNATLKPNPLRVLSHALPSPSASGHAFPVVIDAIHGSTPAQPTVWINVFHAIQGRFNLADLPTSPPSTPGPAVGGDDYFTQKVFDTAVPISDYQQDLSSLPRSPRPVVPPSSINVSIVERYIPPSSANEFQDMFNPNGPSVLVDRLVELSPTNGTLIFVYPTRTGAETFMKEYLGPLLDPQLRSLVVVNGLSTNLSRSLGRMVAVDSLPEYPQMQRSMARLCDKLTQESSNIERFHGRRATFSLVHASREEVQIDREAWSRDWWAKQEKQRIRDMMTRYAQEAQRQSSNEHVERSPTPTELIQQLLDGVTKRSSYPSGQAPNSGVEVSVFVIKRSD